jgi:hypothetical protein
MRKSDQVRTALRRAQQLGETTPQLIARTQTRLQEQAQRAGLDYVTITRNADHYRIEAFKTTLGPHPVIILRRTNLDKTDHPFCRALEQLQTAGILRREP